MRFRLFLPASPAFALMPVMSQEGVGIARVAAVPAHPSMLAAVRLVKFPFAKVAGAVAGLLNMTAALAALPLLTIVVGQILGSPEFMLSKLPIIRWTSPYVIMD